MSDRSNPRLTQAADPPRLTHRHLSSVLLKFAGHHSLSSLLETVVTEVQSLLECDRVILYQLTGNGTGTVIAEAILPPWRVSLHHQIYDRCFDPPSYSHQSHAINDVSQQGFSPCYLNLLAHFQVKSYLFNVLKPNGEPPWGFLMAHQCDRPRIWTDAEIELLDQLSEHITLALERVFTQQSLVEENQHYQTRLEQQEQLLTQQSQSIEYLEQTRQWQQQILKQINEAAIVVDDRGHLLYWSPQAETLYQIGAEQAIGQPLEACCQFFGSSSFNSDRFQQQLVHQGQWQGTIVTGSHDGPKRLVEVFALWLGSASPHGTGKGSWLAILRPVSEMPLLDMTIHPQEYQFSRLVESAPVGLFLADPMGACRYVNPHWCQTTGLSREDCLDYGWLRAIHPGDRDRVFQAWDQAVNQHQHLSLQYRILRRDQRLSWISGQLVALYDPNDNLMGYLGTLNDITSEKLAQDALQESEEKFRQLAENIRQIFFILSREGAMLYISPTYQEIFERPYQDLYENPRLWLAAVYPGDRRRISEALDRQIRQGEVFEETYRILRPSGEVRWLCAKAFPVRDHQGQSYRFVGLAEDISDRKLAEDALKRQYRNVLLLKKLTQEIRQSLDSEQIFQTAAYQIGRSFSVSRCLIFSYESDPQPQLRAVAESRHPTLPSLLGLILPIGEHPYSAVIVQQDIAQVSDDVSENPLLQKHQDFLEANQIRSMLGIRTSYQGQANGEICLHQCSQRRWSSDEVNLLEAVAAQVGIALAQAAMLQRETAQREELSAKNLALAAAKQEAEAANLAKSRFLAMMSHEIRTPLNAVIGTTELLFESRLDAQQQEFVNTIRQSSETLLSLINDILDVSKIESEHLELESRPFELDRALLQALDLVAVTAQQKGLNLCYSLMTPLPQIWRGDVVRLKQILINLLGNAVKFTEQGEIRLSVEVMESQPDDEGQQTLHLSVEDTGIGIPRDRFDRLFQPFSQSDSSMTRRYGGTGLGLTISQRLCQLMEGQITLESELGQGSTFHVTLKLVPEWDSPRLTPVTRLITPRHRYQSTPSVQESPFDPVLAQQLPLRILVAEDLPINQVLVQQLLTRFGYRASLVNNGLEAVQQLNQENFDLVFMDVQMPELDGWAATRQIRQQLAQQGRPQPYIIALTAHALAGDRQLCLEAGMDDYLSKPLRATQLRQALERYQSGRLHRVSPTSESVTFSPSLLVTDPYPILDMNVIDELQQMAGEVDFVIEMIESYLNDVPQRLQSLQMALEGGQLDMIEQAAHALGSLSASLGAAALTHRCRTLEDLIRQGDFLHVSASEKPAIIEDFQRDFDRVQTALTTLLHQLHYD
ncbi:MAG: PAS domain S-box protein [Sodalinema sp.]|uniref:PAS domain S-box protein n=1 Tax=Sodalinema sp. TaxID=3080550 RepID=UPI0012104FE7|nr:MAG: PAS domain S-box protein [Phormidium sp. SL48-SHIP]